MRRPLTSSEAVPLQALQRPVAADGQGDRPPACRSRRRSRCPPGRETSTSRSKWSRSGSASRVRASFSPLCLTAPSIRTSARPERISTSPPSRAVRGWPVTAGPIRSWAMSKRPMLMSKPGRIGFGSSLGFSFGSRWRTTSSESRSRMISRLVIQPSGCQSRSIRGGFGEQALRIVEPDVAKPRPAPDRSFDPADADLEARIGRQSGDPVGEEAVARRGVEQGHAQQDGEDQAEQQADDALGEPAVPAAAAADLRHLDLGRSGSSRPSECLAERDVDGDRADRRCAG